MGHSPSPGVVQLWFVSLDSVDEFERLLTVLSRDELDRVNRIADERIRRRYVVGRAVLRRLLGERLATPPAELRFDYNEGGKPALECEDVNFNLSHSGDLALIAISNGAAVGVDVEQLRPQPRLDQLARRVLTVGERELLEQARAEGAGARWFLQCWTAKEAVAKAFGFGLALAPNRINVVPLNDWRAVAEIAPAVSKPLPEGAAPLQVRWLPGVRPATAAVATEGDRAGGYEWRWYSMGPQRSRRPRDRASFIPAAGGGRRAKTGAAAPRGRPSPGR
jgi:4'-phosphopantetheinyl transferase